MIYTITILLLIAISCKAECGGSNATALTPFNLTEYLGIWYQIAVTKGFEEVFERDLYCVYANYTINPSDNSKVVVTNTGYKGGVDGPKDVAVGSATQAVPNTAELEVTFGNAPTPSPYWGIKMIDSTTTGQYDIVLIWSCENTGPVTMVKLYGFFHVKEKFLLQIIKPWLIMHIL
eukprot:CAMPEP_0201567350 /NCGR_PEP_ID=MMETSP0190_2-20130828/7834_1 /ASSEMBLY_ACC=CAM_ASM_000263 /TAXON_ID=37353 /ORGANISM="Rosalina sp." /LENGTH=175 /DNA_ID=CAMNT_0047987241 /DNA_START=70 /DNA_END=598 /DNA_ORIENTATION=-